MAHCLLYTLSHTSELLVTGSEENNTHCYNKKSFYLILVSVTLRFVASYTFMLALRDVFSIANICRISSTVLFGAHTFFETSTHSIVIHSSVAA